MTEKEFRKKRFGAGTLIEYRGKRMDEPIICSLCEVDFDEEIITICPIDSLNYEQDKVQVSIKHCEIHDKKIKNLTP